MTEFFKTTAMRLSGLCGLLLMAVLLALMFEPGRMAKAQTARDWADLMDRLSGIENRLRSVETGSRLPPAAARRSPLKPATAAGLALRLSEIEDRMRKLTGRLEDLSFRLRRLSDQLKRPGAPPDRRRSAAPVPQNSALKITRPPAVPGPGRLPGPPGPPRQFGPQPLGPQVTGPPPGPPAVVIGPQLTPAPVRQAPLGVNPPPVNNVQKAPPGSTLGRIPSSALGPNGRQAARVDPRGPDQPVVDEAGSLYERAYERYLRRQFDSAESAFRGFLRRYPGHELAGQAQYWLGESFYARNKYRQAARAFLISYRKFPKGRKAPASLLKLSMTLKRMGEKDQACATLDKLAREYPRAERVVKTTARSERKRAGCS
jgi:tol-pal system protein YbgF